jgi:hypothetical protein
MRCDFIDPGWPEFIQDAARAWGAPVIGRNVVGKFSGGLLHPRSMANADCQGTGPSERILMGSRRVGYPLKALCAWWADRVQVVKNDRGVGHAQ